MVTVTSMIDAVRITFLTVRLSLGLTDVTISDKQFNYCRC